MPAGSERMVHLRVGEEMTTVKQPPRRAPSGRSALGDTIHVPFAVMAQSRVGDGPIMTF